MIEQSTDRELMAAAYQLTVKISNLQKQLVGVQNEIDRRVKEFLDGKAKGDVKNDSLRDNNGD